MASVVLAIITGAVAIIGLGLPLSRRLPFSAGERLSANIAISLTLLYLIGFATYLSPLPWSAMWLVTIVSAGFIGIYRYEIKSWWSDGPTRCIIVAWLFLCAWSLALALVIAQYAGGNWINDWIEHYQRVMFFLDKRPADYVLQSSYTFPARPPLVNAAIAAIQAQVGPGYPAFQILITIISTLAFFPLALFVLRFSKGWKPAVYLLAVGLACNPMFTQNVTYSWTKLPAAIFILLAIYLYVEGWHRDDRLRIICGFAAIAAGVLAHWSAAPFLLFLAMHYSFYLFWKRRRPVRELAAIMLAGFIVLTTWFGWAVYTYGLANAFRNPSSGSYVDPSKDVDVGSIASFPVVGDLLISTLVPFPLRESLPVSPVSSLDVFHTTIFVSYQSCILTAAGLGVLIALVVLGVLAVKRRVSTQWSMILFWLLLPVFVLMFSISTHVFSQPFGVAQLCMQSLVYLAIGLVVAKLRDLPRPFRILLIAAWLVELCVGVLLHFYMQSQEIEVTRVAAEGGGFRVSPHELGRYATANALRKANAELTYLFDLLPQGHEGIFGMVCMVAAVVLLKVAAYVWKIGNDCENVSQPG